MPPHEPEIGSRQRIAESIEMLMAEGMNREGAARLAKEAERDMQSAIRTNRAWQEVFDTLFPQLKG